LRMKEEALQLFRHLGDRKGEAITLGAREPAQGVVSLSPTSQITVSLTFPSAPLTPPRRDR
jgi:hypothetical protein